MTYWSELLTKPTIIGRQSLGHVDRGGQIACCVCFGVLKEQYRLYSPADGIWSQVGGSGRSNHSIVIWESDGDVVVLEDRRGD